MPPLNLPPLSALIHHELKRKKSVWEATCLELAITVRGSSHGAARDLLAEAVRDFLQTASDKEIESRLAKGTTYFVESLPMEDIVREDATQGKLQIVASGALAVVEGAKEKSGDLASSVVGVAAGSGRFVADKAAGAYGAVGEIAGNVYHRTHETVAERAAPLLIGLTERTGHIAQTITDNRSLRQLAKSFHLEQWLDVSNHVDTEKAAQVVDRLKREFPAESNRQIARRLITQKAIYAGGVGISTSLPGIAIPMLALDMAATSLLQAELVLQIAAVYGLNLEDPARKGEMLAVFGCVLGGGKASKVAMEVLRDSRVAKVGLNAISKVPVEKIGLGVLRNVPLMGAAIGATSNAVMIYALGNTACSFYEKRLDLGVTAEVMALVKQENALYLEASAQQKLIAEQVLLHVVLAGNPATDKAELLAALREMNFSPSSIDAIERDLESPKSLDELLPRLDDEFGVYVSTQAQNIAQLGGEITKDETEVLGIIESYFTNRQIMPITKIDIGSANIVS